MNASDDDATAREELVRIKPVPEVDAVAKIEYQLRGLVNGRVEGDGIALDHKRGTIDAVMRAGRAPRTQDEVALGVDTARRLHAPIGDRVELAGPNGSAKLRVVGQALLPTVEDPAALASGFVVVPKTMKKLGLDDTEDATSRLVVTFEPGVAPREGRDALERAVFVVSTPLPPPEVARLREVESLPQALAIFLALLGAVAVALALLVTVRRRRHDFALLRTFGFTGRQVFGSVAGQANVFAALGLALGIPIGWLAGRVVWSRIADSLGVATDATIPVAVVLLTIPAVLVVVNVAALVPAHRATRLRPAEILRGE